MKTCPNPQCNMSYIPDDAKFCPNCGTHLEIEINKENKQIAPSQSSYGFFGGIMAIIVIIILAAIIGIRIHNKNAREKERQAEIAAQNNYLSTLDSNGPSGFQEGQVDFDYPIGPKECMGVTYSGFEWRYDEQCYVCFTLMKCQNNENVYGFAIYYGPNIRQASFQKTKIEGFVDEDNKWIFETYDQDNHLIDKYEGKWLNRKTFSGVCTNRRGKKIQFEGID